MVLEGGVVVPENTFKTVDEQNPEQAEPYKCDTCLSCKSVMEGDVVMCLQRGSKLRNLE